MCCLLGTVDGTKKCIQGDTLEGATEIGISVSLFTFAAVQESAQMKQAEELLNDAKAVAADKPYKFDPNSVDDEILKTNPISNEKLNEMKGYNFKNEKVGMNRNEWKEHYRQQRLNLQSASEELKKLPKLEMKKDYNIEKMLKNRGYSNVTAKSGGSVWTKSFPDGNTMAVRIDPPNNRVPPLGYADEVYHAHKEIVETIRVVNGNYSCRW